MKRKHRNIVLAVAIGLVSVFILIQFITDLTFEGKKSPNASMVVDGNVVTEPDEQALTEKFDTTFWQLGSIALASGVNIENANRARSVTFLDDAVLKLHCRDSAYRISLYGWKPDGTYVGVYNGSKFKTAKPALFDRFDISSLRSEFPGYKFRVVVFPNTANFKYNDAIQSVLITKSDVKNLTVMVDNLKWSLSKHLYAKDVSQYGKNKKLTLGDVVEDGFYVISDDWTVTDAPVDLKVQALTVEHFSTFGNNLFVKQTVESMTRPASNRYHRFSNDKGEWSDWVDDSAGGDGNHFTFNNYSNTYNVTAKPNIKTDTNNYLASTGDKTDMTASIVAMLKKTGVCNLGPGVFYVSGIDMPDKSSIMGSGASTIIRLNDKGTYAIKMNKKNKVSDLTVEGSESAITLSEKVEDRHGILWSGNYSETKDARQQPESGIINGVWISNFTGGGITCYNTGYDSKTFLSCSDVIISGCNAGVNIAYWSEFHRFTNVRTVGCYYGCINNGGNNNFVNCNFSSCEMCFLMDNANNKSPNNSHGSVVGCTFAHAGGNKGIGIKITGCKNGYIFTGCQIFYAQINVKDSEGIVFSSCNFGSANTDITVSGGGAVMFTNNMHQGKPKINISKNKAVKFINCFVSSTGEEVS